MERRVNGIENNDIPDPDAFSHVRNANQVIVHELGQLVKLLCRVLAGQTIRVRPAENS